MEDDRAIAQNGPGREKFAQEVMATLLERRCRDLGHPMSSLGGECLCGLTRYD